VPYPPYSAGNLRRALVVSNPTRGLPSETEEDPSMRALLAATGALALVAIAAPPASAGGREFSIGPGGVHVYRHHHDRYGYGADCRELREACLRKDELGEGGRGNCRRYREVCGG